MGKTQVVLTFWLNDLGQSFLGAVETAKNFRSAVIQRTSAILKSRSVGNKNLLLASNVSVTAFCPGAVL